MQLSTVTAGNISMRYMRFGNLDGKPFVVLPGLSLRSVLMAAPAIEGAYKVFSEDFDIYLFDRKDGVKAPYTVEDMADDTAAAMKELGIKDAAVMGFSQGGMMAQVIAVKYPELVSKLVLGSTTSRPRENEKGKISNWVELAKKGDIRSLAEAFGRNVYSEAFYDKYKDLIYIANKDASDEEISKFITLAEGTEGFDVFGRLKDIKAKTLVLADKRDKIISPEAYDDFDEIPGVAKYLYDQYGHAVYDEAPDFFERVLCFLNDGK